MDKLKQLAKQIIKELKRYGFIMQRYNAYSTKSIYIKLDYGVSHSLRISDHKGKKHLSYRFNLLTDIKESYAQHGEYERHYYCKDDVNKLIEDIKNHREHQIAKYGEKSYRALMNKNRLDNADKKGFWALAVRV